MSASRRRSIGYRFCKGFSLGACIYQAITHHLIEEAPARIVGEDMQPKLAGSEYEKQYSHAFLAAVDYAPAAAPSASATQAAYNGATAVYGAPQQPAAPPATPSAQAKNKLLLWGGIGAAVVLIAVLAAFLFAGKGKEADEPVQQAASAVQASPVANAPIVQPPANNSGGAQPAPQQPDQPHCRPSGRNEPPAPLSARRRRALGKSAVCGSQQHHDYAAHPHQTAPARHQRRPSWSKSNPHSAPKWREPPAKTPTSPHGSPAAARYWCRFTTATTGI